MCARDVGSACRGEMRGLAAAHASRQQAKTQPTRDGFPPVREDCVSRGHSVEGNGFPDRIAIARMDEAKQRSQWKAGCQRPRAHIAFAKVSRPDSVRTSLSTSPRRKPLSAIPRWLRICLCLRAEVPERDGQSRSAWLAWPRLVCFLAARF